MEVSIVIPVFNRAEVVKPTLESVKGQTHSPIHLILVDNNSSDNTLSVLQDFKRINETEDFKIDVIKEDTPGASAARNAGARLADSEWLMFFDSDDTMDSCLVEKYVKKIESCSGNVDIVTTNVELVKNGKVSHVYFAKNDFMANHIFHSCLSTIRYIVRKDLFESVGGWNESLSYWDDWELGIRLLLRNPRIKVIDDGVYIHINVHEESITGNSYSMRNEAAERTLNAALTAVETSGYKWKRRAMNLIMMRRFVLAGLYKKEKNAKLAKVYYDNAYGELKGDSLMCFLAPIVFRYVSCGGRGIDRLLKLMF